MDVSKIHITCQITRVIVQKKDKKKLNPHCMINVRLYGIDKQRGIIG